MANEPQELEIVELSPVELSMEVPIAPENDDIVIVS